MFGIVLWSAAENDRAVVWCEDHGDLAFFQAESVGNKGVRPHLDAGDLLQFELNERGDMRLVENPRVVAEEHYPSLACKLREVGEIRPKASARSHPTPPSDNGRPIVVPFPGKAQRDAKKRQKGHIA